MHDDGGEYAILHVSSQSSSVLAVFILTVMGSLSANNTDFSHI